MSRTICAMPTPVTLFSEELMKELMKRLPREICLKVVQDTLIRTQERLIRQGNRKSAYKAILVARTMAQQATPVSDDFAVLLGLKSAEDVDLSGGDPMPGPDEDFLTSLDIPEFSHYSDVFQSYPYIKVLEKGGEKIIILGHTSGRGKTSNKLYRRNCMVKMPNGRNIVFKDIVSVLGPPLAKNGIDGTHHMIKAIKYIDGIGIRFWTNIISEGDIEDQYRYVLFTEDGMKTFRTEPEWEIAVNQYNASCEGFSALTSLSPQGV